MSDINIGLNLISRVTPGIPRVFEGDRARLVQGANLHETQRCPLVSDKRLNVVANSPLARLQRDFSVDENVRFATDLDASSVFARSNRDAPVSAYGRSLSNYNRARKPTLGLHPVR